MEKSIKTITISLVIITIVVVSLVFKYASVIFLPFIVAVLLSYILTPILKFFEKIKIPRLLAIALVLLLFVGVIIMLGNFLYMTIESFVRRFDRYLASFATIFNDLLEKSKYLLEKVNIDVEETDIFSFNTILSSINWKSGITSITSKFANFTSSFGVIMLFLIFLLLEKPFLKKKLLQVYSGPKRERILNVFTEINDQVVKYLSLKFMISLATGIVSYLFLKVIGLDFPGLWGFLAFLLNFIPSIGSIFAVLIIMLMGLAQFGAVGEWGKFFAIAFSMTGTQFIIGNFIDPRLQGQKLNLSPLMILFSLMFWGWIWGVLGMFLAVPLMVIIKIVIETIPGLEHVGVMMGSGQDLKEDKDNKFNRRLNKFNTQLNEGKKALKDKIKNKTSLIIDKLLNKKNKTKDLKEKKEDEND